MRSHRVWSDINAANYATSKSFGGEFTQSIAVGSSASYSNWFANVEVREYDLAGDWSVFSLSVDGDCVKKAAFNNKTKDYTQLPASWQQYNKSDDEVIAELEALVQ